MKLNRTRIVLFCNPKEFEIGPGSECWSMLSPPDENVNFQSYLRSNIPCAAFSLFIQTNSWCSEHTRGYFNFSSPPPPHVLISSLIYVRRLSSGLRHVLSGFPVKSNAEKRKSREKHMKDGPAQKPLVYENGHAPVRPLPLGFWLFFFLSFLNERASWEPSRLGDELSIYVHKVHETIFFFFVSRKRTENTGRSKAGKQDCLYSSWKKINK